jgi:heat shock protein HtpX
MSRAGSVVRAVLVAALVGAAFAVLAAAVAGVLAVAVGLQTDTATTVAFVGVLALCFGFLSYRIGTARLLARLDAAALPRDRAPGVVDRFDALAADMGVVDPTLLVADVGGPNALSLGGRRNGFVVVDRRLFRLLSREELAGVLAHELAHLRTRDSLVQSLAYSLVRSLATLAFWAILPAVLAWRLLRRAGRWLLGRPTEPLAVEVAAVHERAVRATVVALVALTLATRAYSRYREFVADDRAVAATGDPLALATALRKIDRASRPRGLLAELTIAGEEDDELSRLLSTHPPMDDRIRRLVDRADEEAGFRRIPIE